MNSVLNVAAAMNIEDLVDSYYDDVFRVCSKFVGPDGADDCAQDTFVAANRALAKFRGESSAKTWLFGIAQNACRNYRRKHRWTVPLEGWHATESTDGLIDASALREALLKLDPDIARLVILKETEGLTYEECAEVFRIPVGTVKSRLHNAFLKLRRLLCETETTR
ncbi:MAG: RNA polymerase sigma factor [Fimbriimonadales bacterium]